MWTFFIAGVFLLLGSVMIVYGLKLFYDTVIFLRAAARTIGTVIRFDGAQNSNPQGKNLAVFEYRTNDGSVYQLTSTVVTDPPAYEIGDTATLLYHKRNPRNARIKSFTELWLVQVLLIVFGIICSFTGLFMFLKAK